MGSWERRIMAAIIGALIVGGGFGYHKITTKHEKALAVAEFNEKTLLACLDGARYTSLDKLERALGITEWKSSDFEKFQRGTVAIVDNVPKPVYYEGETFKLTTPKGTVLVEKRRELGTVEYYYFIAGFELKLTNDNSN